ncbi:hypothetical protein B0T20DRAFT_21503 [Sordaria brevicollis]|uniref:Uncharacterized protein n=1 Tax=Sordaria brevicollis TaxID=83679 RepID=A0AAE0UHE5_SORBR|nr:hypothetical protein B0T20DRAFT_21503 [Sordaria brevicollis]
MCGPETPSSTPRVGARVDFFASSSSGSHRHLLGNLLFLNPSTPNSQQATHFSFISPSTTPSMGTSSPPLLRRTVSYSSSSSSGSETESERVVVSIHQTGDLTKSIHDCGLLKQFTLDENSSCQICELQENLSITVGTPEGIIGRRVSMMKGGIVLGDGIVGYNC